MKQWQSRSRHTGQQLACSWRSATLAAFLTLGLLSSNAGCAAAPAPPAPPQGTEAPPSVQSKPQNPIEVGTPESSEAARPPSEAAPETPLTQAPDPDGQLTYRAELEDRSISLKEPVRHLTWTCHEGSCVASGPALQIGTKSCVSFGAVIGAVVTRFQFGDQELDPESMQRCQLELRKLEAAGKLAAVGKRRRAVLAAPKTLAASESYFEVTSSVGQMQLSDGSLRFVFPDGSVALLRPDGELFRFDAERRLNDAGTFVRWQSVEGNYLANDPIPPELRSHCSSTNGGIQIVPGQMRHDSTFNPACAPHPEDFRAIFTRTVPAADAVQAARDALFDAPYAQAPHWKRPARGTTGLAIVVGSATSTPGYFKEPAQDMLQKVQQAVQDCARYVSDPSAQLRGEVLLLLNAFGAPKTALVRRTTYPDPERFSVCIEQRLMKRTFQSNFDVSLRIPFQIGDR